MRVIILKNAAICYTFLCGHRKKMKHTDTHKHSFGCGYLLHFNQSGDDFFIMHLFMWQCGLYRITTMNNE